MDVATMDEMVCWISDRVRQRIFTQHVVVNVAKIVNMRSDRRLADSVRNCDVINIDGMGVVWAARILGYDVPERVAGIDLFSNLIAKSEEEGFPVFFLGGTQAVVEKTGEILAKRYPELQVAGLHHGYFEENEEAVVNQIARSGARLLFVAISSPKKEIFIDRWKDKLGVNFVMGVGGTFDVIAGQVRRAPLWMQKSGLEWLFRVIQEPRRMWKRYLITNCKFSVMLLRERMMTLFKPMLG